MRDARAEAAAGPQDAGGLANGAGHVVDVHQRVECDRQVEARVGERQRGGIGDYVLTGGMAGAREVDERRRRVDADHGVTARGEIPRDAPFSTGEIQRSRGRRR
jgi:hypothetical protein